MLLLMPIMIMMILSFFSSSLCQRHSALTFSPLFFSSYTQRNKNIKDIVVRHSISDSDLCERLIGNTHTHIFEAPACYFSFILSFQIVTCLHFSLSLFFFFRQKKRTRRKWTHRYICVRQIHVKTNLISYSQITLYC